MKKNRKSVTVHRIRYLVIDKDHIRDEIRKNHDKRKNQKTDWTIEKV